MANEDDLASLVSIKWDIASKVPPNTIIAGEGDSRAKFSDPAWDVAPLIGATHIPASNKIVRFDFEVTPGRKASEFEGQTLIQTMKEFAYARLSAPPPGMRRRSPHTVIVEATQISLLARWLLRRGITRFSEATSALLDEFRDHLMADRTWEIGDRKKGRNTLQVALVLRVAQRLWEYRDALSDTLPCYPWHGVNPRIVIGFQKQRGEENRTPVIPDGIVTVLGWHALRYVEHFSKDIIELRTVLERARAERLAMGYSERRTQTDVDGWIFRKFVRRVRLSTDPETALPWRTQWAQYSDFRHEERMLIAACFVVVAWLSGMRVSEILAIRDKSVVTETTADGRPLLRVYSRLFKGVPQPQGRSESWTIVPPVAGALETVAAATAYQRHSPDDVVFRNTTGAPLKTISINEYVNLFRDHVSALFSFAPIPPGEDGRSWHFNTRQFRRTLAKNIARQPFGVIAGMLQYKHVHIATFEGYAGTDNLDTWKRLLAQERLLANADFLEEVAHDVVEGNVTGPKGEQMLREFRGAVGDRREDDIAYYLRHKAKCFYPGTLNYCFFEPETAMCLSEVKSDAQKTPVLSFCHPDRCANSCISARHKPAWEAAIADAEAMQRAPRLSSLQRVALDQEIVSMKRAIIHLPVSRDGT
ncbi:MAG: integrase [Betaproteobacteria bacterium]|nr:integrase [Betaproteobacteria bacterium]MDE2122672.1 integrase [Betaproteobacteria bacterium]